MSVATSWGSTEEEQRADYPCDAWPEEPAAAYFRGVTVEAPAAVCFRWLCQLRAAPYSYDWIDNFGRRSPQQLTPGLEKLEVGQTFMGGFTLRSFTPDRELTFETPDVGTLARVFGRLSVTYRVVEQGPARSRYVVKLRGRFTRGPIGWLVRVLLPWGDLIMMRRQLLNLKRLAERDEAAPLA